MIRAAASGRGQTEGLRRADYLRSLAVAPEAAKESAVFGLADWLLDRFKQQWMGAMELLWAERRDRDASPWAWSLPWGALSILAMWLAGNAAANGELSIEGMTIVIQAAMQAGSIWISNGDMQLAYGASAVPAVLALEEALDDADLELSGGSSVNGRPSEAIRVEGLAFAYPGRDEQVFDCLDLEIPAGRSLAIVGDNGAGKTTLISCWPASISPRPAASRSMVSTCADLDIRSLAAAGGGHLPGLRARPASSRPRTTSALAPSSAGSTAPALAPRLPGRATPWR